MNWTEEQQRVIGARGNNLLVSAAAGSGKTAVLVERIIGRILDPADPVDLDELLIVTFTRAAAGEMKERIMKRLADVTEAHTWVEVDDEDTDPDSILLKKIPARTRVYEINGPMFFAAADKYKYMLHDWDIDVLCIRMRNVPAIDATGVEALLQIVKRCERHGVKVVFSHVNEQPMHAMEKAGFVEMVGQENFCSHIDTALARCGEIEAAITAKA